MSTYRLKGASGKVAGMTFPLGAKTLIGRADHCDVRVNDELLAPQHAEIEHREGGGLRFRHLAQGNISRINGALVQEADLASGDEIHLGNSRWVLQAPGLRPSKVLDSAAVESRWWARHRALPWLLALAAIEAAALAWQRGWLPF